MAGDLYIQMIVHGVDELILRFDIVDNELFGLSPLVGAIGEFDFEDGDVALGERFGDLLYLCDDDEFVDDLCLVLDVVVVLFDG